MNLVEQNQHAGQFFGECMEILNTKGKDYTPEDESLKEVREIAAEAGITPRQVLWVYLRKHVSAIQRWVSVGKVESEPVAGRLRDLANYAALMRVLELQDHE